MDSMLPENFNPHLEKVLKSYQTAATRSLSGPSCYVSAWSDPTKMGTLDLEEYRKALSIFHKQTENKSPISSEKTVTSFPVQHMPILTPMDAPRVEKTETILENETIACFVVGGEKRLCLPQILNTVLRDFSLNQINSVCDDLHIYCSRCNPEQLEILKVTGVLPISAPSCGLITKTDAERLCSALLYGKSEHTQREPPTSNSFRVYHECFGKCKGMFTPELYVSPYAKCIECHDCHGMFTPQKFVCHSHKCQENRTCHWGFDSANWRSYLLLVKCQEHEERLQDLLDQMKARFDFMSKFKRKDRYEVRDEPGCKRIKREQTTPPSSSDLMLPNYWLERTKSGSAFRPWSPGIRGDKTLPPPPALMKDLFPGALPSYLQTGPPVLLNPERVVPMSESSRYERHYAPNVSLAPLSQQMKSEVCDEHKGAESTDYDLVETSDDSVPPTPDSETAAPFGGVASTIKEELKMIDMLFDGKVPESRESRENFLQEFSNLHMSLEGRLRVITEELKRVKSVNVTLQKENEVLRLTNRDQFRELSSMKTALMRLNGERSPALTSPPPAHHQPDNHMLEEYQQDNVRMRLEISDLKAELDRLSTTVGDPLLPVTGVMSPRQKALAQIKQRSKDQVAPVDMTSGHDHN